MESTEQNITRVLQKIDGVLASSALISSSLHTNVKVYAHAIHDAQNALRPFHNFFASQLIGSSQRTDSSATTNAQSIEHSFVSTMSSSTEASQERINMTTGACNITPTFFSPPRLAQWNENSLSTPSSDTNIATPDNISLEHRTEHLMIHTPEHLDTLHISAIEASTTESPADAGTYSDVFGAVDDDDDDDDDDGLLDNNSLLPSAPVFSGHDELGDESLPLNISASFSIPRARKNESRPKQLTHTDTENVINTSTSAFLSEFDTSGVITCGTSNMNELNLTRFPKVYQTGLAAEYLQTVFDMIKNTNTPISVSEMLELTRETIGDEMLDLMLDLLISRKYIQRCVVSGRTQYQLSK